MSVESIVQELICDLLCETVEEEASSEVALPLGSSASDEGDIATLLHLHLHDRITLGFSLRRSRIEVVQLNCIEQRASGYCGHYALFFALEMLEACCATSAKQICCHVTRTKNPGSFWKRYWMSMEELLKEVGMQGEEEWWPWTTSHIHSGDMERSFLNHLLSADTQVLAINTYNNIHVLHYAYGLIQSSTEEVCAIQKRILELRQSQEDRLAFILGVTNHWVTIVVEKRVKSRLHVFYLDSNNEPVLMATETELQTLVKAREQKYMKRKGIPYTDWKRNVLYQSFVDQRDIVELLVKCMSGEADLRGELTKQAWSKLIESFYESVSVSDGDDDLFLASLVQWIEQHYPTSVINKHHLKLFERYHQLVDKATSLRLHKWIRDCDQYLTNKQTGLDVTESFHDILNKLKTILSQY